MKLLVSALVLGLVFQTSARVLQVLPKPECATSACIQDTPPAILLPVESGNDGVIFPVESGNEASILPTQPEYIWPVRPVPPVGFVPSPPENSVLPVESERPIISLPGFPGASNKLPPSGGASIGILPVESEQPIISLPFYPEASNKLPPTQPEDCGQQEEHIPDHLIIF